MIVGFYMDKEVKSTHLKLRIPKDKKEQIRRCAYAKGLSMSSFIRYVLSEHIEDFEVQEDKTIINTGGKSDER